MTDNLSGHHSYWRGLGLWNLYFLGKIGLYWAGIINFHPLENLVFAAVLLIPLPPLWLHKLRHLIAIPMGIALFYYDTWLPPFARLLAQPEVLNFSNAYLMELAGRFINWELLGAAFVFIVVYCYVAPWLRLTFFSLLALFSIALVPYLHIEMGRTKSPAQSNTVLTHNSLPPAQPTTPQRLEATTQNLTESLSKFYATERDKRVAPVAPDATSEDFDILFLSVCSLAWSDLEEVNLQSHSLLQSMDVVFDNFNSATSYSGPALLRLLRASCGQSSHSDLYQPTDNACYLFDNLKEQGFNTRFALNHDGQFQGFADEITDNGRYSQPYIPSGRPALFAFDGSPIYSDSQTLSEVWKQRLESDDKRQAILYNTISLHDGNRKASGTGFSESVGYQELTANLLDDLQGFINELDQSDRKVMVVLIPEHGAGLVGDRMQVSGMREIPASTLTHVPVGVKLVGGGSSKNTSLPVHVDTPVSHFALSELLNRIIADDTVANENIDWAKLTQSLSHTLPISENDGVVVQPFNDDEYVRLGNRDWVTYPK